ncbi:MAG: agmatine deiminase family protein [Lentilactobacillus diolivorans]
MQKRIGFLALIICAGSLLVAGTKSSVNQTAAADQSTIYTALPSSDDTYYHPFNKALHHFDNQLARLDPGNVVTITQEALSHRTSNFTYDDIWLRDVAPVITTKMIKFRYHPSYLKRADSHYLDQRFRSWLNREKFNYQTSNLVLDGGNLIWNNSDTVILTTHVFADNPDWSRAEIIAELKTKLAVHHVIFIPTEPGDVLGHADGMVKFISARKLFISDFSGNQKLVRKVQRLIKAQLPDAKFVLLPSAYTSKGQYDAKIALAKGLYINMLETPNTIYVPHYGLRTDAQALRIVKQQTTKKVVPVDVARISTTGGSVHCLTWDVPTKFLPKNS